MSQENVEIVRRIYDAWLARDYETVLAQYDPQIRLNPDPEASWVGINQDYVGHDGVKRYLSAVYEAFEDYRPEIEQIIDVGEDRVLTFARRAREGAWQWRGGAGRTDGRISGRCATARPCDSTSS